MLGPFDSYSDALIATCNKVFKKPRAAAGRGDQQDFATRWRVATEYCAWLYYTPDHQYFVSKLTDQSDPDPTNKSKSCLLPSYVEDSRYPGGGVQYVYALHNHPHGSALSPKDIGFIVSMGRLHGYETRTKNGPHLLSIVAFFSNKAVEPTCDGFHQYIPITGQLMTWTHEKTGWDCKQTGRIVWLDDNETFEVKKTDSSCVGTGAQ